MTVPPPKAPPPKRRRSLSHLGGPTETEGEPRACRLLAHALAVTSAPAPRAPEARGGGRDGSAEATADDDPDRSHVHGFHTYPARMHPETAARLVEGFAPEGGVVLDPFCGSGTVLVEALLAGRAAIGVDLNPLAVELARLKVDVGHVKLDALRDAAAQVAAHAEGRRKARAGATRRYPPEDVALFDPHVLLELDSLRDGQRAQEDGAVRAALGLCLSAILVKVSKKPGDTTSRMAPAGDGPPRRIAAGYTGKLFRRKADELATRIAAFRALAPARRPQARLLLGDARELRGVDPRSVDAVVTSPPYAATYDYVAHHALRLRWLGLPAEDFTRGELGARRAYARLSGPAAVDTWRRELGAFLTSLARVTRKGAPVVLLLADSAVGRTALRAEALVLQAVRELPFHAAARASQARPHFHDKTAAAFDGAPRREHALLLLRR